MNFRIQSRSIALRLIVAVLAVELLSAVLVVFLSYGYERHMHFRAFDVMLHGRADSVLGAVQDAEDPGDNVMLAQADLHLPPDDVYEVQDGAGRLLGRSSNWQGIGSGTPERAHGDLLKLTVNGHRYLVLRMAGSRTIDPGDKDGGKVRQVTILYGSPVDRVWHSIFGAVEFYAAGSALLLLVTGPLIAWLLHRGLLPLRQLAALASGVSVDSWEFTPPASAYTTPELAPLTHALESVLQRLERSFLQQKTFVSDSAHELKTAVAVQKSSLQLLNMKRRSPQEYQAGLERCLADAQRLEALVADMLALARAESQAPAQAPHASADLIACIDATIAQLEPIASLRNVRVLKGTGLSPYMDPAKEAGAPAPDGPTRPIHIPIPPEDCTLVLCNLLLNALQHSPPDSTVDIGLTTNSQTVELVVQDHGEGIPADALPHVFDRFYRGDPSRTRTTGGTGLGLAIVKAIVQKAGGTIALTSQPDPSASGHGATAILHLPLSE